MIPFLDLKAQYQSIKPEIDAAVIGRAREHAVRARRRGRGVRERVRRLLRRARTAIAVNSGTSALHLALLAAGVGPGDEVITVPFTFVATVVGRSATPARGRCSSTSTRVTFTMDPASSSRRSRRGPRRSFRCISTARWRTWSAILDDRRPPRHPRHRGRLPGARRRVQGPPRRQHGRLGLLQLLSRQESRRLRRGRHGGHQQRRARQDHPDAARLGPGEALSPRAQGLQLPDGRHCRAPSCG